MAKKTRPHGVIDAAARATAALEELGATCALVGGLAVGARAEPRYTRDVDLAVATEDDEAAERIVYELARHGYVVASVVEQKRTGRLATARLRPEDAPEVFVDLLFASSGIEPEVVGGAEQIHYGQGLTLPVARLGHLLALKVLSESDARLQDRLDLAALARIASAVEWELAESAARTIRARGCHRGRALVTRLRRWRRRSKSHEGS